VIIPTYNRAHLIGRSIKSVLKQSYKDFEIIVVDDASTDNTKEVVMSFDDPRIQYISYEENKGASVARNMGIEIAKGKYIAFQDSDDEWMPEKLGKQMKVFENASMEVEIIHTDMLRIDENGEETYWYSPNIISDELIDPNTLNYQVYGLGLGTAIIKKSCFDKAGLFNEYLPRFIDLEFFIRLSRQCRFAHIEEPLVKYYATPGISTNFSARVIAEEFLLKKYYKDIKNNKKFLARKYHHLGFDLWHDGQLKKGRQYLVKAVKANPLNIQYVKICAASFLGQNGYSILVGSYRKMKELFQ